MKFSVYSRKDENSKAIHAELVEKLHLEYDEVNPDIVITVGGDGTILRAVDKYIEKIDHVIFLGINSGHLGFYTNWLVNEISDAIKAIEGKAFSLTEFKLLEYKINNGSTFYALNEVTVSNPPFMQEMEVYIEDYLFETFRGSGLCISTPSGSTAYNKSLGGAIIDPSLDVTQITEIASINSNVYRTIGTSLVLPKNKTLLIKSDETPCIVTSDFKQINVPNFTSLQVKLSDKQVRFLNKNNKSFWERVNKAFI